MKALIVDDNTTNQYMLKSLLTGNGFEVVEASQGQEALTILRSESVDLVISDILMPVMDGFSLCREIRADYTLRHLPFIFYTATYTGPKDESFSLDIGADAFVIKPCEVQLLLRTIAEVMEKARHRTSEPPVEQKKEEEILKLYNERLVRKLEQKMMQAEKEVEARREAEEALRRSQSLLTSTQRISRIGGWEWDVERREMFWTEEMYRIHDLDPEEALVEGEALLTRSLQCFYPEDRASVLNSFTQCMEQGIAFELEGRFTSVKGRALCVRMAGQPIYEDGRIVKVLGYMQDDSERKQHETEKERLREQLLQAQKLESIGQLAGGVAHDFNNILTVILGYGEVILNSLSNDNAMRRDVEEIIKAGQRAGDLTRQLLIFSRKHVVQPQVINLNTIIKNIKKMLNRLIGENIDITTMLSENIGSIKADPGQIEQVIMNLVINARDAMPTGGKLFVETSNFLIDDEFASSHLNIAPGMYIMLSVTDTGCGMDKETLNRIFEPFFTTKENGKGTGLGLSTVYGIVKQADGAIRVYSEPCKGTTFKVFLPCTTDVPIIQAEKQDKVDLRGNGEWILLVEDDQTLRLLIEKMIGKLGYHITTASNGEEALVAVETKGVKPELLLTDVVMPGMNGRELVHHLRTKAPELKVLFMSGYTDNAIAHHGVIEPGNPFIQKPFTSAEIATQIKKLLHGEQ